MPLCGGCVKDGNLNESLRDRGQKTVLISIKHLRRKACVEYFTRVYFDSKLSFVASVGLSLSFNRESLHLTYFNVNTMGLILNKDWFVHVFVVVSLATESKCWQVFFKVQTKLKNLFGTK